MNAKPFWRERILWLVIGLPLAAVIAGIGMVVVAQRSGGADTVTDEVKRVAQIQTTDLGPDQRALQLKLSAVVRSGKGVIEVIPVAGDYDRRATLTLALRHPARAELDLRIALAPTATGWRVDDKLDLGHDWNVQLEPSDRSWRLQGRWPAGQQATYLRPALQQTQ
jgi:hypothetical protein